MEPYFDEKKGMVQYRVSE